MKFIDGQKYDLGATFGIWNAKGGVFICGNTWVYKENTKFRSA
jgi:hypothetical protein